MQKVEKVEIEIKYPEISKDITILKKILLPIEFTILQTLVRANKPLSTRELYTQNIIDTYADLLGDLEIRDKKSYEMFLAHLEGERKGRIFASQSDFIAEANVKKQILKKEEIRERFEYKRKKGLFNTTEIREMEKTLRANKIRFPSYLLVQKTSETLISWGFLAKRGEEISKNASFFLILNPRFLLKYNKELDKLLEL